MNILLLTGPYFLFIILFAVINNFYSHKNRIKDSVLEESLKTADQYEIAFLKGGKNLTFQLAFYHLLSSGYLEKEKSDEPSSATYRYRALAGKDSSSLHEVEQDVLMRFNSPTALGSLSSHNFSSLMKYQQKLIGLHLLQVSRKTFGFLWKAYSYTAWILSISYLFFGAPSNWLLRIINVIAINLIGTNVIWSNTLSPKHYFDGMLLTNIGERYIKLFEKRYFPLPDFKSEQLFRESQELNPCSA